MKSFYDTLTVPLTLARKQRDRKHLPLRRAADRARDRKNWPEAIQLYERYLALVPREGSSWVQLGHVRKENGQYNDAETAYLTAQALMPRNADLFLQLGHLFKLQGRRHDAVASYAASLKLAPSADAYAELIGLHEIAIANNAIKASETKLAPAIYLQVNDLLSYLEDHKTVSGIQRVQLGIIEHVIDLQEGSGKTQYRFVCGGSRGKQLFLVDTQNLRAIASCLSSAHVDHGHLRRLVMTARSGTISLSLGQGDTFVVLGAYWNHGGVTELLRSLKATGVKIGIYFHDVIPVSHPEFFDDLLTAEFTQSLVEVINFIDFGLAVSDFTRDEVARFVHKNRGMPIPLQTIPLAHGLAVRPSKQASEEESWPERLTGFQGKRFVVFVSTIEPRKNHRYLFEIWKALIDEGVDVPLLIFIGRQGWRVDDLISQLKTTAYLDGRIVTLHDLSDGELAWLYRHCLFTTFPSLVEGWGLPIGESLSFGKLCVASNTSAMPEVGGAMVEYVDPLNARAAIDTFRRLIGNPEEVSAWEARIKATFQQRDWSAVSRHFLDTLSRTIAELPAAEGVFVPELTSGEVFEAGRQRRVSGDKWSHLKQLQRNLIFQEYWSPATDCGMHMAGSEGKIIFRAQTGASRVVVLLRLGMDEPLARCRITAESNDAAALQLVLYGDSELAARLFAHPEDDGCIRIRLRVERNDASQDAGAKPAAVVVRSVGYAAADDPLQWTHLLENALKINDGASGVANSR